MPAPSTVEQAEVPHHSLGIAAGQNTISGLGLHYQWRPGPIIALAGGLGVGVSGLRWGAQLRYFLLPSASSPYLGIELHGNSGRVVSSAQAHDDRGRALAGSTFAYVTPHSELAGVSIGYQFVLGRYFAAPSAGWAWLISGRDPRVSPAVLSAPDMQEALGDRGGPQLGLSIGIVL